MNVLSLFAGIGGLDLGLEWAGFHTIGFVEKDPACRYWLAQHWPGVAIHDDIHTFSGISLRGSVDLVCGGFPCQPFSVAGKQKGTEDERHLWPEMSRIIREVRPAWVLAENVPGLRTIAADLVLEDLEGQGYACWPLVVGVDDVGAPHRRKRVWIVGRKLADARSSGRIERKSDAHEGESNSSWESDVADPARHAGGQSPDGGADRERTRAGGHKVLANSNYGGGWQDQLRPELRSAWSIQSPGRSRIFGQSCEGTEVPPWPSRPGEPQHEWEAPRLAHTYSTRRTKAGSGHPLDAGREPEPGRSEGLGDPAGARCGAGGRGEGREIRDEARRSESERRDGSGGMADSSSEPPRSPGQPRQGSDPREPESPMGGATTRLPCGLAGLSSAHRREALKALGNAVSPPCAYYIGRAIMKLAEQEKAS